MIMSRILVFPLLPFLLMATNASRGIAEQGPASVRFATVYKEFERVDAVLNDTIKKYRKASADERKIKRVKVWVMSPQSQDSE